MQFTIERVEENGLTLVRLKDKSNGSIVSIIPEYGGLLHEFIVLKNGMPHNVIENYENIDQLKLELEKSYRSAKLSPFVCRIDKGRYSFNGQSLEITRKYTDGSAIHGLVYNKPFEVVEQFVNENNACIALRYEYRAEDPGYPYNYACVISYTLMPHNILQLHTTIQNLDTQSIPISDGWHPYFKLGGDISNWVLQFPTDRRVKFNERLVPTGEFETDNRFVQPSTIGDAKLDNCYLIEFPQANEPVCTLSNPEENIRISVYADSGYPYLQVFTAVHRQSVAIENLSGAPDCFNNRMGVQVLQPAEVQSFHARYQVEV